MASQRRTVLMILCLLAFLPALAWADVPAASRKIDALVDANLKKLGIAPNPLTTDEQFVRRIYLDIAGRIPTQDEASAFLLSSDPDRRSKLIDKLLDSEGYVSHWFHFWADLLRAKTRLAPQVFGGPYLEWIKSSLRENKPYDQMVYELLTSKGRIYDDPAAGYYLRDPGMPLDNLSNTIRIFLGTQIGCAQCHDHPYDKWTQMEFYEMSAYTYGVQTKLKGGGLKAGKLRREVEELAREQKVSKDVQTAIQRIFQLNGNGVSENKFLKLKLPDDYKYQDAKPGSVVAASVIFGDKPEVTEGQSPREAMAKWLTSPANPRFAQTIANRLWKAVMGVGQLEPVDDVRDDSKAENPELLAFLTTEMVRTKFDLKASLRALYNTQAYQRQAHRRDVALDEVYHFPGPTLRRMTAEQVWDSLLTLSNDKIDATRPELPKPPEVLTLDLHSATAEQVLEAAKQFSKEKGKIQKAFYGANIKGFARASDMPSPAPPGHFLREFGQSDREIVDGANLEPSITQALALLNGPVSRNLTTKTSPLMRKLELAKDPEQKVRVLWLSMYSRLPSRGEEFAAVRELKESGELAGTQNLVWALINTREFLYIQ